MERPIDEILTDLRLKIIAALNANRVLLEQLEKAIYAIENESR